MYKILITFFVVFGSIVAQQLERQIESSVECHEDANCQELVAGSVCIGNTLNTPGHCRCKKDYIPQANRTYFNCLPSVTNIDDLCEDDIQCEYAFGSIAECRDKHCLCREGTHFVDNTCYKSVRLGDTCYYRNQCRLKDGGYAACVSGTCVCSPGYHPHSSEEGESCELTKYLGDDCNTQAQCITENSQCSTNICTCKAGYSTSLDGQNCLKVANHLGEYCTEDSQCEVISDNAYCESYRCICRTHHHKLNNQCYRNKKLNETCTQDKECWVFPETNDSVSCNEGICTCRNQYSHNGWRCVNAAGIEKAGIGITFIAAIMTLFRL